MTILPRGLRNDNPGNIRHSRTLWQGEAASQPDADFVTFTSPEYGFRAIAKILRTYQSNGLNTVRKIISRWAPPNENNTRAYIASVAQAVGVNPDTPIDLSNDQLMASVIKAITRHENGQQPYADAVIAKGIALAMPKAQAA